MSVYPVRVGMVLDDMIVISPIRTCVYMHAHILLICTVCMYIFYVIGTPLLYLLFVQYKWCVVLSIVVEHQFHCLCCLSLPTGGVHGHFGSCSLWPSHCSTDTS